jgi:hypothetical protein
MRMPAWNQKQASGPSRVGARSPRPSSLDRIGRFLGADAQVPGSLGSFFLGNRHLRLGCH